MRVLILSCNTGEGHNSCAGAIREIYEANGDECVIADTLSFISKGFSRFISWGHITMYRHLPWLFRFGYRFLEEHPAVASDHSALFKLLTLGSDNLYAYLLEGKFDQVICVHIFSAAILTDVLRKHPLHMKTALVSTDYTCSPGVHASDLDWYFIPDASLTDDFAVPDDRKGRIAAVGIPIRQMFYRSTDSRQAKASFDIPEENRHLLIMCGSMGCGPIKRLAGSLEQSLPANWDMSIVCGSNQKLQRQLQRKFEGRQRIHIHGYVQDMSSLMDSADLYLTKPGGLGVSEAWGKGLPMVYIDAVAGCEAYNLQFFVKMGGARTGKNADEVVAVCRDLMENEEELRAMRDILRKNGAKNAAFHIYAMMNG